MADVEFAHLRDRGDRGDIVIGEPVTRMGLDPVAVGERAGIGDSLEFGGARRPFGMGIGAGMEFEIMKVVRIKVS